MLLSLTGDGELGHRRFRVWFSKDEPTRHFSVALDIFSLSQNESVMEDRKVGLPSPAEPFTLRFQTAWMRDKASTLPGKANNVGFQNREYAFLLLCFIMTALEWYYHPSSKMCKKKAAVEGGTWWLPSLSLIFPQNGAQGDTASLSEAQCPSAELCTRIGSIILGQSSGLSPCSLSLTLQPGQSPWGVVVRSQPLGNPKVTLSTKGCCKNCSWWGTRGFGISCGNFRQCA